MVATDGHRLALAETDHKFAGLSNEARTLIPKKAMIEIQRLADDAGENEQIEFARDESHLFFRVGDRTLISRILTGQFPNYEAVLRVTTTSSSSSSAANLMTPLSASRNWPTSVPMP